MIIVLTCILDFETSFLLLVMCIGYILITNKKGISMFNRNMLLLTIALLASLTIDGAGKVKYGNIKLQNSTGVGAAIVTDSGMIGTIPKFETTTIDQNQYSDIQIQAAGMSDKVNIRSFPAGTTLIFSRNSM